MEIVDAVFQPAEAVGGLASADVKVMQTTPIFGSDETCTEDYRIVLSEAAPEIGEVHSVKGFS